MVAVFRTSITLKSNPNPTSKPTRLLITPKPYYMQAISIANELRQPAVYIDKLASWLRPEKNKTATDWVIDQLGIQPYQHILEIGYASGYTLKEVARKLKIGFLAGIDGSITKYQQAYRRNKKLIRGQLLQLHIGNINELPYPHHYFHTIYATDIRFLQYESEDNLIQLASMLKSGGKLVMAFQPARSATENDILLSTEKIKQDFIFAGLADIEVEYRDMYPASCIAIIGYKE